MRNFLLFFAVSTGLPMGWSAEQAGTPSEIDAENAKVFHGFYYTSKKDTLVKLTLGAPEQKALKKLLSGEMKEIAAEKYWLSFGRFMITPVPKAYIAWEGRTLWLVQADKVDDNHNYVKEKLGIHVFEFTKDKLRYCFHETPPNAKEPVDEFYSLIYTWWDWELDGEGEDQQKKMAAEEKKVLAQNMDWTDAMHERMQKKHPPETLWKK